MATESIDKLAKTLAETLPQGLRSVRDDLEKNFRSVLQSGLGKLDLVTVAACLQRCVLYIGNDSGLMHLAAAAGVPTLGLFGPSPAVHYAPWGPYTAVAQTDTPYEELVGGPDFDDSAGDSLMTSLSVESVEAAAAALWQRAQGRAA